MVKVVVLVCLEMVFPSTVRGRWGNEQMDTVPHEGKGGGKDEEGGSDTAVVVEVLDGMHAQPREGFDVGVAVVERVDVLVESLDVDEPVSKVEVKLAIEGNPEGCQNKHCCVPAAWEGLRKIQIETIPQNIYLRKTCSSER